MPLFKDPVEYAALVLEEGFAHGKCKISPQAAVAPPKDAAERAKRRLEQSTAAGRPGTKRAAGGSRRRGRGYGIGLTCTGLKQAYARGEGDLGRDMAVLSLGSLSHYLKLMALCKVRMTPSLGRLLCRPMAAAPVPAWFRGTGRAHWRQQLWGYAARLVRGNKMEQYFPKGLASLLSTGACASPLGVTRAVRKKDGSAATDSFSRWLAWLVGHPGAVAQQVFSLQQNTQALRRRWRDEVPVGYSRPPSQAAGGAAAGGGGGGGRGSRPGSRGPSSRPGSRGQPPMSEQEELDASEREAALEDEKKAKDCLCRLLELCQGTVEEMISCVLVSGNLSLRLTMSGLDVHRLFYDDMEEEKQRRARAKEEALEELREQARMRKKGRG